MSVKDFSLYTDKGLIVFSDGKTIAIESRQYSHKENGDWEDGDYNPFEHKNSLTGIGSLPAHNFTRVRHVGDTYYQDAVRLNPKEVLFRVNDDSILEWKYLEELDTEYRTLFDISTLQGDKGEDGDQGVPGKGLRSDSVSYYAYRPDCGSGLVSDSSCKSCNPGGNSLITDGYYFVSIGDGLITITPDMISTGSVTVDSVIYTHQSNEALVWVPLTSTTEDLEVRYLATDANGTGAIDMRSKNYYDTLGHLYVCADNKWTDLGPVMAPVYMVQETAGSTNIGYLDTFTTPSQVGLDNSITIEDDKLKVAVERIDETAFIQTTFGDGLDILNPQDKPIAKVSDYDGFGLQSYESNSDGYDDLQVSVQDFISNGLTFENETTVDGEQRDKIIVNLNDIIDSPNATNTAYTGLTNSTAEGYNEEDEYDNLYVKPGDCIAVDNLGVNVIADELSLTADTLAAIKIKEYAAGNDGVMAIHLNPNVANELKGLLVDNNTGIEAKLDSINNSLGFNGNGEIWIPENAIQGLHLNDNVVDTSKGLYMNQSSAMIETKIDDLSIVYNGSGELTVDPSFIEDTMAGSSVTKIAYAGTDLYGDITLTTTTNDTYNLFDLNAIATRNSGSEDILNLILDFDEAAFETTVKTLVDEDLIENRLENILTSDDASVNITFNAATDKVDLSVTSGAIPLASTSVENIDGISSAGTSTNFSRADHKHAVNDGALTIAKTDTLQEELDKRIELGVDYGGVMITTVSQTSGMEGLILKSDNYSWKVSIDDLGNLHQTKVG